MINDKTGAPTIYGEPLDERIAIRVTKAQKKKIMQTLGTANIREILIDYVEKYKSNQLPLEYANSAGAANSWEQNNEKSG